MVPASFAYHRASSVREAMAIFAAVEDACFLAGGQSLTPMLNARQLEPRNIIDLNPIEELGRLSCGDGSLRIGALVRHSALCDPARLVMLGMPPSLATFLATAGRHIGNLAIRNRGTVGGSVALAEPHAEWPLVLTLLGARVIISGPQCRRQYAMAEFLGGPGRTMLAPGELIIEIVVALSAPSVRYGFSQTLLRHEGTRVTAVTQLTTDGSGRGILSAAVSGLAAPPTRLVDMEVTLDANGSLDASFLTEGQDFASGALAKAGLYRDDAFARQLAGVVIARAIDQVLIDDRG